MLLLSDEVVWVGGDIQLLRMELTRFAVSELSTIVPNTAGHIHAKACFRS